MSTLQKVRGTTERRFSIGGGLPGDVRLEAAVSLDAPVPFVGFNDLCKKWEASDDGVNIHDLIFRPNRIVLETGGEVVYVGDGDIVLTERSCGSYGEE